MAFHDLTWTPFEPKKSNLFYFYLEPAGIPNYIVRTASRPSVTFNPVVVDYMNIQRKFAGKPEWQDISITLTDPIGPEGSAQVHEWLLEHHQAATGTSGYAYQYKKRLQFDSVGPDGQILETWVLEGAFINSVNWGNFDYTTSDLVDIEITLSYDYAELTFSEPANISLTA